MVFRNPLIHVSRLTLLSLILPAIAAVLLGACSGSPKTASLVGSVRLEGETNHEGIDVYIPGTSFRALTDMNGRFRVDGIPGGAFELVAVIDGYREFRQDVVVVPGEILTVGSIVLGLEALPVGAIGGTIRIEGLDRHEGIVVLLVGVKESTITDTEGAYRFEELEPGVYNLAAFKQGFGSVQVAGVHVARGEETEVPEQILENPNLRIEEEDEKEPEIVTGSHLILGMAFLSGASDHTGTIVEVAAGLPAPVTVQTATNGDFTISNLPEGRYDLLFRHDGYVEESRPDVASVTVSTFGILPRIAVTLMPDQSTVGMGAVKGIVQLDGAASHEGTEVSLIGVQQTVQTGLDGAFTFVGVPNGSYILVAQKQGYVPARTFITVQPTRVTAGIELTLRRGSDALASEGAGEIQGRVLLEGTGNHTGVLIAVEGTPILVTSGPDGFFSLPNVPAGPQILQFEKAGYESDRMEIEVSPNSETEVETMILAERLDRPFVTDTVPRDREDKVPIVDDAVNVQVTFSEPMSGGSVKQAVQISPEVAFRAFFDRETELANINRLHIQLLQLGSSPIKFKQEYRVTIDSTAASMGGVEMGEPYRFSFETDGPLIVRTHPEDGAEILKFPGEPLWFETNARIDPQTLKRAIDIKPRPDSNPEVFLQPGRAGVRVSMQVTLKEDKRYQVTIGRELRTVDGLRFSNTPYRYSFRTIKIVGDRYDDPFESSRSRRGTRGRNR